MLGLFSAKSEHPLASTKEAKRIAVEISQLPPEKAMGEASTWFESLTGIDDFAPLLRFERIVEIANASPSKSPMPRFPMRVARRAPSWPARA